MCDVCGDSDKYATEPGTPERRAEVDRNTYETVLEHGHQIMGIFGDDEGPPFFYTVGRGVFGKPELLLTGPLSNEVAGFILNETCRMIDAGELTLNPTGVTEVPANELLAGFPCRIQPADPRAGEMFAAINMAPELDAYQVVWPDLQGVFPGEAGWDQRFQQPLYPR